MKKSLIISLCLVLVLSVSMVSASWLSDLFSRDIYQGPPVVGWSDWYNRDNPGGTGDYETLKVLRKINPGICEKPSAIECQTIKGVNYTQSGEKIVCSPEIGAVCINKYQKDKICEDYKVRFYCDKTTQSIEPTKGCEYITEKIKAKVLELQESGANIVLIESGKIKEGDYVVLPFLTGGSSIYKLTDIYNQTTGSTAITNDRVTFQDVFTGNLFYTIFSTTEGVGDLVVNGTTFGITFEGSDDLGVVMIKFPLTISKPNQLMDFRDCFNTTEVKCDSCQEIQQTVLKMLNNCNIYSVSVPDANKSVRGNDICNERNAGTCIFTVSYEKLNDAINNNGALGNTGLIESCSHGPFKSTDTVAYCCKV